MLNEALRVLCSEFNIFSYGFQLGYFLIETAVEYDFEMCYICLPCMLCGIFVLMM